jgi:hypothetical protein
MNWRSFAIPAMTAAVIACSSPGRSATADSTARADSPSASSVVARARAETSASTSDGSVVPAEQQATTRQQATTSGGPARKTGGPYKPPALPRGACRGTFVNVTVKQSALGGSNAAAALPSVVSQVLAPVRSLVDAPQLSPAIRAFRVSVRDAAKKQRVLESLRASPQVERAELDECAARIQTPKARPT